MVEPTPPPDGRVGRGLSLAAGFGISALFLYLTFRGIDLAKMRDSLSRVNYPMLSVPLAMFALHFTLRAMRWGVFIRPLGTVSLLDRQAATVIGFATNNLLPFRLGEFARAYVLTTKSGIPFPASFATVALARIFDILALGVVFVALMLVFPLPPAAKSGGLVAIPACLGILGFLIALKLREAQALAFLEAVLRAFPQALAGVIRRLVRSFLPGLESVASAWDLLRAFGLSLATWALIVVYNSTMIRAYGLDLPWYTSLLIVTFLAVAISVPQAPGYWGVYQGAVVLSVGMVPGAQVSDEDAAGFALLLHGCQFLLTTLWGVYYLMRGHVSLKGILAARSSTGTAPQPDAQEPRVPEGDDATRSS